MHLRIAASTVAATFLLGTTAAIADPPNFDFNGYTNGIGSTLQLASVLTNNGVVPTPVPLDFANNQYTLVVSATFDHTSGNAQRYGNATVQIWADPIGSGTAASYATPATFTDGTLILGGSFDGFLIRNTFIATLGNFVGRVDWQAGSAVGLLPTPQDWPFGGGWSRTISGIPAGYVENWDGLIDLATVGVEPGSWGKVKNLFR
jgi:hypothetical protein